jgi:hypothetical protein
MITTCMTAEDLYNLVRRKEPISPDERQMRVKAIPFKMVSTLHV